MTSYSFKRERFITWFHAKPSACQTHAILTSVTTLLALENHRLNGSVRFSCWPTTTDRFVSWAIKWFAPLVVSAKNIDRTANCRLKRLGSIFGNFNLKARIDCRFSDHFNGSWTGLSIGVITHLEKLEARATFKHSIIDSKLISDQVFGVINGRYHSFHRQKSGQVGRVWWNNNQCEEPPNPCKFSSMQVIRNRQIRICAYLQNQGTAASLWLSN